MSIINKGLRFFFFVVIIRPIVWLIIGLNFRNRVQLPETGPAIIVANHNSHLDTIVLMSLMPIKLLDKIQPVAAADYFLANPIKAWFAKNIIGILPISRQQRDVDHKDPITLCSEALDAGKILIFFPEGSRGAPEKMKQLKFGIANLAGLRPDIAIHPIFMHGLGKSLPKGDVLLVPYFCDIAFGNPMYGTVDGNLFMSQLANQFVELKKQVKVPTWD